MGQKEFKEPSDRGPELEESMAYLRKFSGSTQYSNRKIRNIYYETNICYIFSICY